MALLYDLVSCLLSWTLYIYPRVLQRAVIYQKMGDSDAETVVILSFDCRIEAVLLTMLQCYGLVVTINKRRSLIKEISHILNFVSIHENR